MSLGVRERLGPYDILAPVGAAGIVGVWKARAARTVKTVEIQASVNKPETT
jgi:hypothetical protein